MLFLPNFPFFPNREFAYALRNAPIISPLSCSFTPYHLPTSLNTSTKLPSFPFPNKADKQTLSRSRPRLGNAILHLRPHVRSGGAEAAAACLVRGLRVRVDASVRALRVRLQLRHLRGSHGGRDHQSETELGGRNGDPGGRVRGGYGADCEFFFFLFHLLHPTRLFVLLGFSKGGCFCVYNDEQRDMADFMTLPPITRSSKHRPDREKALALSYNATPPLLPSTHPSIHSTASQRSRPLNEFLPAVGLRTVRQTLEVLFDFFPVVVLAWKTKKKRTGNAARDMGTWEHGCIRIPRARTRWISSGFPGRKVARHRWMGRLAVFESKHLKLGVFFPSLLLFIGDGYIEGLRGFEKMENGIFHNGHLK